MRIVLPFGFYGFGNIGDEATLNGFARLLSLTDLPVRVHAGSRNSAHTRKVEPRFDYFSVTSRDPRRWWAKLRATAQAVVGGTPIMDIVGEWPLCELTPIVRSLDRWKVPMAFVGVGVERLRRDESRRLVSEEIAPRVCHWTVRSERDCSRLKEYGVRPSDVTTTADLAWLIEPATPEFGRARLQSWGIEEHRVVIAVNLVNENAVLDKHPEMAEALAAALDSLVSELDAKVLFLSNEVREDEGFDRAAASRILQGMKQRSRAVLAPNEYLAPREMMSIIGCCRLALTMRYHFCIFSALQQVPFIAIERADKVADLCWDLGWPASLVPPGFTAASVVKHAMDLAGSRPSAGGQLAQMARTMKERAARNVLALEILESRTPARSRRSGAVTNPR